jgi:Holliday junction resolvasome RuvABC endonuclease subunit
MQGALVVQAEMQGVVKEFCERIHTQYRGYSPSEIKKKATGKGMASKDIMLAKARERWANVEDHNQADALWLLDLARGEYGDKT